MKRLFVLVVALCLALCPAAWAEEGAPRPALEAQRSVSRQFVPQGGGVTLSYRVENTGNVPLTQISLTDPMCGLIAQIEELAPGEYRACQVDAAVTQECESAPLITWYYGQMRYERALDGAAITPAVNDMRISLSTDRTEACEGDNVALSVHIANNGNSALSDIRLQDAVLGDLGCLEGTVAPGETRLWTLPVRMGQTSRFCITARAESESGEIITAASNEAMVALVQPEGKANIAIGVSVCEGESPAGTAFVDVTLTNGGAGAVDDITVTELGSGVSRSVSSAAPGDTVFRMECPVQDAREAQFIAQYTEDNGEKTTVLSAPVTIEGGNGAPKEFISGNAVQLGNSAYAVFLYSGIGVILLLAAFFVMKRVRKMRRRRIAREKRAQQMRLMRKNARMNEEEWVQTREHKPVSLPPE